jgi:hypothetical protein
MPKSTQNQQVLPNTSGAINGRDAEGPAAGSTEGDPVTDSTRSERIRLAAYLAAERRGFEPGYEESDWLQAEREVDAQTQVGPGDAEASSKPT